MSHKTSVKIRFKGSRSSRTDSNNSSTVSISCSPVSSASASPSASDRTAWWLQHSSSSSDTCSSQESVCHEVIRKNVDKLGQLAEKCERLNSNLDKVVAESHTILDNSFFASQTHLTEHVTNLNYNACLDIGMAIDTYSEYMQAVEEMVDAEDIICNDLADRLEKMNKEAQSLFLKVS